MKSLYLILFSCSFLSLNAQDSLNMEKLYNWSDPNIPVSNFYDIIYNEVYGYEANGREYGIIGSTMGTHIIDVTDLSQADTVAYIPGAAQGAFIIHRDYHIYQNYLYAVCDEGPSTLQIMDLSYLPDSVHMVYDEDSLLTRAHNIFIDTVSANMYVCYGKVKDYFNRLSILSLANNPEVPEFVLDCNTLPFWTQIQGVHDVFVKNDTVYCNAEGRGMFVVDFNDINNPQIIGSLTNYPQSGYNHSGWLKDDGNTYALADETHGLDIKILDVSDLNNISVVDIVGSNVNANSIPHNLIFLGDDLYASYYFDGLYVFDVSDPSNVALKGFYDTSTEPHANTDYKGNWGVYPFLSSGKILASDMQNGLYVLSMVQIVGNEDDLRPIDFVVFPNPSTDIINVISSQIGDKAKLSLLNIKGETVLTKDVTKTQNKLDVSKLETGTYILKLESEKGIFKSKKVIVD